VALTAAEIYRVVGELGQLLPGARLDNIFSPAHAVIVLRLEGGTLKARKHILLSAERETARIHLLSTPFEAPEKQTNFCQLLRKHIRDSRVDSIIVPPGERIVEFLLNRGGNRPPMRLIAELFGAGANIILIDTENNIRGAIHERREKNRDLHPHRRYVRPEPAAGTVKNGKVPEPDAGETFNEAVEGYFDRKITETGLRKRAAEMNGLVTRELKRVKAKFGKLEKARSESEKFESVRIMGELLKINLDSIERGSRSFTVENVFEEGSPSIEIPLDPTKSAKKNMERCFKKYRKMKNGLDKIDELLPDVKTRLDKLDALASELESVRSGACSADEETIANLADRLSSLGIIPHKRRKNKVQVNQGPRRFRSRDGFEILVGRSMRENDELTIRMARGNDIFLHASGHAGSHVIVRVPRGKSAPLDTLLEAAHLAAHYSKSKDARRVDIHYTQRKHVSKPKGARPGLVHLSRWKTLSIKKSDPARDRILGSRIRQSEVNNDVRNN
jgi:predicted ribosome quality control (RQC) complex YloA/Tae2 family protein